jgi:hypothetical protein
MQSIAISRISVIAMQFRSWISRVPTMRLVLGISIESRLVVYLVHFGMVL